LYPSFRLAQLFPTFPESALILQYKTPWPKNSLQHESKSVKTKYDKRFEFITQTLSRVVVFTLASMIQLPQPLQDSGLQIFLICFFGFVIRLHVRLFRINPFLAVLPAFVVIVCVHLLTLSSRNAETNRLLKTHPLRDPEEGLNTLSSHANINGEIGESKDNELTSPSAAPLPVTSPPPPEVTTPQSSPPALPPPADEDRDQDEADGIIWESSDDEDDDDEGDVSYSSSEDSEPTLRHERDTRPASFWEDEDEDGESSEEQEFSSRSSM
jgi:hypothetical protein